MALSLTPLQAGTDSRTVWRKLNEVIQAVNAVGNMTATIEAKPQMSGKLEIVGNASILKITTNYEVGNLIVPNPASDRRLKKNIKRIGTSPSGIPIYQFEFRKWTAYASQFPGRYQGTIAQEVRKLRPDAVVKRGRYLLVKYALLDVDFQEVK